MNKHCIFIADPAAHIQAMYIQIMGLKILDNDSCPVGSRFYQRAVYVLGLCVLGASV